MPSRTWTDAQLAILRQHAATHTAADLAAAKLDARRAVKAGLEAVATVATPAAATDQQATIDHLRVMLAFARGAIAERRAARFLGLRAVEGLTHRIREEVQAGIALADPRLADLPTPAHHSPFVLHPAVDADQNSAHPDPERIHPEGVDPDV